MIDVNGVSDTNGSSKISLQESAAPSETVDTVEVRQ